MYVLFKKSITNCNNFKRDNKYLVLKIKDTANIIDAYTDGHLTGIYHRDYNSRTCSIIEWKDNKAVITDDDVYCPCDYIFNNLNLLRYYQAISTFKSTNDITKSAFDKHVKSIDNCMDIKDKEVLLNKSKEYLFTSTFHQDHKLIDTFDTIMRGVMKLLTRDGSAVRVHSVINDDNHFYTRQEELVFANTHISCGVTQLFQYDELLYCLKQKHDRSIDEYNEYLSKIKHILKMYAQGSMVIFSTRKTTIDKYRKFITDLNDGFSTVTRYSYNDNSNNKIGTTMLIAR